MKQELKTQSEAAHALGVSPQAVGMLCKQPGAPTKAKDGKRFLLWPQFPEWYHAKLRAEGRERAKEKPKDLAEAMKRQQFAETQLLEMEVAEKEGKLITAEDHEAVTGEMADRLRATLVNLPSNHLLDLERAGVAPEVAQGILERIAEELTRCLRTAAEAIGVAA